MKNITLLALDTSTEACSVALWHKGEKTHLDELAQRTHTKRILPMVDELLANSGINLKQVDVLAFGSYNWRPITATDVDPVSGDRARKTPPVEIEPTDKTIKNKYKKILRILKNNNAAKL